jgi:hypothetical protein
MQVFQPSLVASVLVGLASRKYRALLLIGSVFCTPSPILRLELTNVSPLGSCKDRHWRREVGTGSRTFNMEQTSNRTASDKQTLILNQGKELGNREI